jgi:hypothetical protein
LATRSIEGSDTTYAWFLSQIAPLTAQRDALAGEIKQALDAAEFGHHAVHDSHADALIHRARALIDQFEDLEERSRRSQ